MRRFFGALAGSTLVVCLFLVAHSAEQGAGPVRHEHFPHPVDDANSWSEPVNGLQARLHFRSVRRLSGTVLIDAYLELANVRDLANPMEIPLSYDRLQFQVTNAEGKVISVAGGPYDGSQVDPGLIRLPYQGVLRFNITRSGAGIPRGVAAMLDLGPDASWTFPEGEQGQRFLSAELTIPPETEHPRDRERYWSGTLKIPPTRIPVPVKASVK